MAEYVKFNGIGSVEATFKTATVSDIAVVTDSDLEKLVTLNEDGQVGIDATNTTELGIAGFLTDVHESGNECTVQIYGLCEVECGETVAFSANRTFLGTYNGKLYLAAAAVNTSVCPVSLIEGGTTSKKAILKLG